MADPISTLIIGSIAAYSTASYWKPFVRPPLRTAGTVLKSPWTLMKTIHGTVESVRARRCQQEENRQFEQKQQQKEFESQQRRNIRLEMERFYALHQPVIHELLSPKDFNDLLSKFLHDKVSLEELKKNAELVATRLLRAIPQDNGNVQRHPIETLNRWYHDALEAIVRFPGDPIRRQEMMVSLNRRYAQRIEVILEES